MPYFPSRPWPNYIPLNYGGQPKTAILNPNTSSACVTALEMEFPRIKEMQ